MSTDRSLILQAKTTGACLNVCGNTVIGTVLSATEFCDFLCKYYNVTPLNLQSHCNGCGTTFEVRHAFSCSKGILIITCHNKVRNELLYLSQLAFNSASVHSKHLIHQGRTRPEMEIFQGIYNYKETRVDIMIRDLWDIQVENMINVKHRQHWHGLL